MFYYSKDSLELLKQRIDLVEVVSSHIKLSRSGASFKALCPFHEEKTASFMIQRGDSHYHCFGCGAHGDAIAFLMSHLKMSFIEAIESLAERFQVHLEKVEQSYEEKGPPKALLKQALGEAAQIFHFLLLHSKEGQEALQYLYSRGIDLNFIKMFKIGYAPKQGDMLYRLLREKNFSDEVMQLAGLIHHSFAARSKDFFQERITFPIQDVFGHAIGFSARKFKETTFGGKYINSPETPLFKKSFVLFGLSYSRQEIAKKRKAIVVEGQLDALRLIFSGFNYTVAGQGTAFGDSHVKELLQLGINHVYLALDADEAGKEASVKIGDLFQKKGVEVSIVVLPEGQDPDSFLRQRGPDAFKKILEESKDYLNFLFLYFAQKEDMNSPSKKAEIVDSIAKRVRGWEHPVMVHESLKKLASISQVPEETIGMTETPSETFIKKKGFINKIDIDPDRILETDLLRWLFLGGQSTSRVVEIAKANLNRKHFRTDKCYLLYESYLQAFERNAPRDFLSLAEFFQNEEEQKILSEIMQKKVNLLKAEEGIVETIQTLLLRHWMEEREKIKIKIQSDQAAEDEIMQFVKLFDEIKKNPPKVLIPS